MQILNLGFDNAVIIEKIVTVLSYHQNASKLLTNQARENNRLVDATNGRETNSVIITTSHHVILSSVKPDTLINRIVSASQSLTD